MVRDDEMTLTVQPPFRPDELHRFQEAEQMSDTSESSFNANMKSVIIRFSIT